MTTTNNNPKERKKDSLQHSQTSASPLLLTHGPFMFAFKYFQKPRPVGEKTSPERAAGNLHPANVKLATCSSWFHHERVDRGVR